MKHIALASASILALAALPAQAQAQTGSADSQNASVPQSTPAANAPGGAAPGTPEPQDAQGLQDVIVTAQRVEQTAQRTPVAISVISTQELVRQQVTRAEDLTRATPSLVVTNSGGPQTTFFLRGVGNFTVNAYSDPAIAFNYDGVYVGRPTSTSGSFYDLQRIEVLKGPQGTLYGRNATGGAINVIPNRPVVGQNSGEFQASYGNYDTVNAQGAINLAIGDEGAFRLSGTLARHDGYLSDGTYDQKDYGLRGQVLANLTPNLNVRVAADYAHQGGVGAGSFLYGTVAYNGTGYAFSRVATTNPSVGLHDPRTSAALTSRFVGQVGRNLEPLNTYPYSNNGYWGVNAEINWETAAGTLTVVPAYRESDLNVLYTTPGFRGSYNDEHDEQTSIEARFAGSSGPVDYLVGGFFFDEKITANAVINQYTQVPYQRIDTGTRSYAGFGKLSVHLGDRLTLTGAGRYTKDRKRFNGVSTIYSLFCGNPAPPQDQCPNLPLIPFYSNSADLVNFYTSRGIVVSRTPLAATGRVAANTGSVLIAEVPINDVARNRKFTYRLAAEFQLAERSLLYASYETGYRGGGFSFARGLESYEPETIAAYTIGSKNRFFNNRVQLNVEAFLWKYHDQQFSQFGYDLGTPPATVFYTANIGQATNKGIDIDVDVLATPTTRISGNVQYLDATYDSFVYRTAALAPAPNTACPYTRVTVGTTAQFQVDCSGRQAFNSPKWAFNANIEQTVPLGDYKLILQAGTRYRGDMYVAPDYQNWVLSKADFLSNASVTVGPAGDRWFVSGFVTNIENNRRLVNVNTNGGTGTLTAITTTPRTYGIRIGGRF